MKKSSKLFLGVPGTIIGLFLLAFFYLYFFFPYDQIKTLARNEAKKRLAVNLELGAMRFSLFEGLSIEAISVTDPSFPEPVLQLDALVIDYDLWALTDRKLQINRILLDSPQINLSYRRGWNVEHIIKRLQQDKSPPLKPAETASEEKPGMIGLPLEIHLDEFVIRNPRIMVDKPGEFRVSFSGMDIRVEGSLKEQSSRIAVKISTSEEGSFLDATLANVSLTSRPGADLQIVMEDFNSIRAEGRIELDEVRIESGQEIPPLDLAVRIEAEMDIARAAARISSLNFNLNRTQQIHLSANIDRLFTAPGVSMVLKKVELDLEPLLNIAGAFVPQIFSQGKVSMKNLHVEGGIREDQTYLPIRLTDGLILFDGVKHKIPSPQIEIAGVDGELNLRKVIFHPGEKLPRSLQLTGNISCRMVEGSGFQAKEIKGEWEVWGEGGNLKENRSRLNISVAHLSASQAAPLQFERIELAGNISGIKLKENRLESAVWDFKTHVGSISSPEISIAGIDDFLQGEFSGRVAQFNDFSSQGSISLDLEGIIKRISPAVKETTGEIFAAGKLEISTEIHTVPDEKPNNKKQPASSIPALTFNNRIQFHDTDLQIGKSPIKLKALNTDLDVRGGFSTPAGLKDLQVSGWAAFSALNLPGLAAVGKSDIQISFSSTGEKLSNSSLDVGGTVALKGANFIYPAKNLTVDNINLDAELSHRKGAVSLSGSLDLDRFSLHNELAPLGLTYNIYMEPGFDRVYIKKGTQLVLAKDRVRLGVQGEVGGLSLFTKPHKNNPINAESILKKLYAHLKIDLQGASTEGVDLPGNFHIQGRMENELLIDLEPGKYFSVEGELRLDDFQADQGEELSLETMSLKLPYRKKLYLFQVPEEKDGIHGEAAPLALQGVFSSIGRFSPIRNNLHILKLKVGKVEVQNIFGDIALKEESLGAERFGMDLFGGGVGGNVLLFSHLEHHVLKFSLEFAGIGFDSLMPEVYRTNNPEDSIGGNMGMTVYLDRLTEKIDLKRLDLHLRITRIGYASLNQFLIFLDPQESNPGILNARKNLEMATPVSVDLQIAHGNLKLTLDLESKTLGGAQFTLPVLNRIPLDLLKNFDKITLVLDKLAPIKRIMEIISARGVDFDDKGTVKFIK